MSIFSEKYEIHVWLTEVYTFHVKECNRSTPTNVMNYNDTLTMFYHITSIMEL